jgi:hypothetical protein
VELFVLDSPELVHYIKSTIKSVFVSQQCIKKFAILLFDETGNLAKKVEFDFESRLQNSTTSLDENFCREMITGIMRNPDFGQANLTDWRLLIETKKSGGLSVEPLEGAKMLSNSLNSFYETLHQDAQLMPVEIFCPKNQETPFEAHIISF